MVARRRNVRGECVDNSMLEPARQHNGKAFRGDGKRVVAPLTTKRSSSRLGTAVGSGDEKAHAIIKGKGKRVMRKAKAAENLTRARSRSGGPASRPSRRSVERRGKSVERRGKLVERRGRSVEPRPRTTPFDDRFFCEEVPAPKLKSRGRGPRSRSYREKSIPKESRSDRMLDQNDSVEEGAIEVIAVSTPGGKLTAGILMPKIPQDKSTPNPTVVDNGIQQNKLPKTLPKGKSKDDAVPCPARLRKPVNLEKSSNFYKECINLSFSNSIVASSSASTIETKAISNKQGKTAANNNTQHEPALDHVYDANRSTKAGIAIEKKSWQEVVQATKLLDERFDVLKGSGAKDAIPMETLVEINAALATIRKHASTLEIQDKELVAAVKRTGQSQLKPSIPVNLPQPQTTWIDSMDFYYCSPLERTCADVLGDTTAEVHDPETQIIEGREMYSV